MDPQNKIEGAQAPDPVASLFTEFLSYRRYERRSVMATLSDRGRYLLNHGSALEVQGGDIPGLVLLEAMLSPRSPVSGFEMAAQVAVVDSSIEAAYAMLGLDGLPPWNPAKTH